ncbi:MAG: Redoxin domain protein [Verrucomicrobiales bacterium]|nr:Redoxin domain protein [Verrucomicrobiales bacterium]
MRHHTEENSRQIASPWRVLLLVVALIAIAICGCNKPVPAEHPKSYSVRGIVKEVEPANKTVTVQHEKIPGYMEAMTMPFDVKNTNELRGLKAGDRISFRMMVTTNDGWIEHIVKLSSGPEQMPSRSSIQAVRAIKSLEVGERVPDFHLTNELGQAVSLADYKGEAFAVTFIFTSCPFPTFCPRMTSNFSEVVKKIAERKDAPKNWQLLSVSFDPEHDRPDKLLQYAQAQHYDPQHWHFCSGSETEIAELCEAFDERYWHDVGTISHNLRTAVIDANGRLKKIFEGNEWSPSELADSLVSACKP